MGVENAVAVDAANGKSPNSQRTIDDPETESLHNESIVDEPLKATSNSKRVPSSRTRRPDRAVYVPKAQRIRSQTTPPSTIHNPSKSSQKHTKKSDKTKSKSIDENQTVTPHSEEDSGESHDSANPVIADCDLIKEPEAAEESFGIKNQKNLSNLCTMSDQQSDKNLTIESAARIENLVVDKDDKDEKELIKASQEINRSNRKLIKQTFTSDVLEIDAIGDGDNARGGGKATIEEKAEKKDDDDDWDTLFDDNGDCLDPKIVEELTVAVGKVTIEKPKSDYKAYQAKVELLKDSEFSHVLECSNFPVEFSNQDLMMIFSQYKESGFEIKWVNDTHCLVVFSSSRIAADVLSMSHSFVKLKPLAHATAESRAKAKKCSNSLKPYKARPETCAALAKRLVSGALGVRIKTAPEERENELRKLREAKERKLQAAKQREESWND